MAEKTLLFVAPAQAVTQIFPFLKEAGVAAGIVDSLPAALAAVRKSRPCLIFSQAKIGTYSVRSLLEEAGNDPNFPPIIVFTDRGSANEAAQFMARFPFTALSVISERLAVFRRELCHPASAADEPDPACLAEDYDRNDGFPTDPC